MLNYRFYWVLFILIRVKTILSSLFINQLLSSSSFLFGDRTATTLATAIALATALATTNALATALSTATVPPFHCHCHCHCH